MFDASIADPPQGRPRYSVQADILWFYLNHRLCLVHFFIKSPSSSRLDLLIRDTYIYIYSVRVSLSSIILFDWVLGVLFPKFDGYINIMDTPSER
jgi:hypothetical protein